MDERIVISTEDIDSTILYLSYIEWSEKNNLTRVSNIEFSRKLIKLGYTNHRENEVNPITGKINNNKKVTMWDYIKLKLPENNDKLKENTEIKEHLGQDQGHDLKDRSCPNFSSRMIPDFSIKTMLGQDLNPFVDIGLKNTQSICENIETVEEEENTKNEILANNRSTSCPKTRFFDSGSMGQDVFSQPVLDPVLQAKITVLDENEENDITKNIEDLTQMRKDLEFFKSAYLRTYGGIESIEVFVGAFEKGIPGKKTNFSGYFKLFPRQAILYEAERICKTVPQPVMSRVVSEEQGLKILEEEGY